MAVDERTKCEIRKKARLFDSVKERARLKIQDSVKVAIEKLKAAERELLDEVEIEFGENPFAALLNSIESGNKYTDEEINSILSNKVPQSFGPDEKAFCSLIQEIESFKTLRKNVSLLSPFDFVPKNVDVQNLTYDRISLAWDKVESGSCYYEVELKSLPTVQNIYHSSEPAFTLRDLDPATRYDIRVRAVPLQASPHCIWSNPITVHTIPRIFGFDWKKCPEYVESGRKYTVDKSIFKTATKSNDGGWCTVLGDVLLPLKRVISWNIRIANSKKNDGFGIYIGVIPSDIDQNDGDVDYGWYIGCYSSILRSGPPHNIRNKEYGPRKGNGQYVHTGDTVGLVMDTTKGVLSFSLNGVSLGVAFEGIPLDKPLIPFVNLKQQGDSVELVV